MTDDALLSVAYTRAPALAGGYERRNGPGRSGEQRLMLAILEDAVAVHVKSLNAGVVTRHDAREAQVWLTSRDRSYPFAFESICDVLGLDPSYIRRGIRTACARPAEAAARFALRHHGRRSGPVTLPGARGMARVG